MSEEDRPTGRGGRGDRSWSEIDRMRDGSRPRDERRPRGAAAQARAKGATEQYLKSLDDKLFAKGGVGGAEADVLAKAVLDGRGSPEFDSHCSAYLAAVPEPTDLDLIAVLLDARGAETRVAALRALEAALDRGAEPSRALRRAVRSASEDFDDAVAYAAEDVLAKISG